MKIINRINYHQKRIEIIGSMISIIGLIYVIYRILVYKDKVDWSGISTYGVLYIAFLIIICGFANFLLVIGWQKILKYLGLKVPFPSAVAIYGRSLLAKYIPGNIFQFAGRQVLGNLYNYPNRTLAHSVLWELGLLAFTGAVLGLLVISKIISSLDSLYITLLSFLFFLFMIVFLKKKFGRDIANVSVIYIAFHLVSAGIFLGLIFLLDKNHSFYLGDISILVGAYVVAWLVGLLTPGAPGGIGVRELILLSLLGNSIDPSTLYPIIGISRIVTFGGDVITYFVAMIFSKKVGDSKETSVN